MNLLIVLLATIVLATSSAHATSLEQVNTTSAQTLANKTLTNAAISSPLFIGTVTGTYTLGGTPTIASPTISSPTITTPTISSPVLSGTVTGTYTLAGTPTISSATITTPTLTVNDNVLSIRDNVDTSKVLQFQASGITASTTRTLTAPDANTTIVGTDATQTLTNKTITAPVLGGTITGTYTFGGTPSVSSGLKFPATQSASADANTLDDYEEGSWTPSVGGSATYTVQQGRYVKIGKVVYVAMNLQINAIGTGNTGTISGLPFTVSTIGDFGMASGSYSTASTTLTSLYCRLNAANTTISCFGPSAAATANTGVTTVLTNSTAINFSGFYFVD